MSRNCPGNFYEVEFELLRAYLEISYPYIVVPHIVLPLPEKKVLYAWQKVTTDTFDPDFVDHRRAGLEPLFLDVAVDERELDGDLILGDIGQGLPFKTGTFDGTVSISALQWLCYASKTLHNPTKRLYRFFSTLYACLSRSARAVLQFYPENGEQVELITAQATKAGFYGGVVVDFPNSAKTKKMVLVLMTGGVAPFPKALGVENEDRQTVVNSRREYIKKAKGKSLKKSRDWILYREERKA
ncbi:probable 18S rRNA (guanine-N(7))-methyltransferase, partial [Temnothorax curvispinosus]|uniref:Probable 18S rRNA (Guanine-N(7))-methyltransferase n=1 Tax=Temnothorax curvispinosus TaxID=300111 RepID=A0A6J1PWY7_9HYME